MAFAYFISETYLKDNTPLTQNVDVQDIYPFVKTAQDTYIKDKLGTALYDELITATIAQTYSASQLELLKLVRQALAWYACYDSLPFVAIKLRNKGVIKTAGDFATNADQSESKYLRQECRAKADYYLNRIEDYLCDNSSLFPNYLSSTGPIYPNHNSAYSDIAFDINDPAYIPYDYFVKKQEYLRRNNNCNGSCNGNCNCNNL